MYLGQINQLQETQPNSKWSQNYQQIKQPDRFHRQLGIFLTFFGYCTAFLLFISLLYCSLTLLSPFSQQISSQQSNSPAFFSKTIHQSLNNIQNLKYNIIKLNNESDDITIIQDSQTLKSYTFIGQDILKMIQNQTSKFNLQRNSSLTCDQVYCKSFLNSNTSSKNISRIYFEDDDDDPISEFDPRKYTYGNWCGKNHGGFDGECKEICEKDLTQPSKECLKCLPPIDYVDSVCVHHDFCQMAYQNYVEESKIGFVCAQKRLNVGQEIQTRCKCTYIIQEKLTRDKLVAECETIKCIAQGLVIEKAFDNPIFDCACFYEEYHRDIENNKMYKVNTQKCISPKECKQFRGE